LIQKKSQENEANSPDREKDRVKKKRKTVEGGEMRSFGGTQECLLITTKKEKAVTEKRKIGC